ncbi:hypothetical protein NHX12_012237, partial [Muraenolepis orangiensis]
QAARRWHRGGGGVSVRATWEGLMLKSLQPTGRDSISLITECPLSWGHRRLRLTQPSYLHVCVCVFRWVVWGR